MRSRLPMLAMLALIASAAVPAGAVAGGPQASIYGSIGQCYMDGTASGLANDQLRIKHRSADGSLKKTHRFEGVEGGYELDCPGPRVEIGDRFQFFEGDASTPFRTFKVPELTLRTDRVADRFSGKATRTTQVEFVAGPCDAAFFGCTGFPQESIPVDPTTHRYSKQLDGDLTGLWSVTVYWTNGVDGISVQQRVAGLLVRPGSAVVGRAGATSGRSFVVSVRRGQSTGLGTGTTKHGAVLKTTIRRNGNPMELRKDDLVSSDIASDATLRVPPTNLAADGQFVWGRCLKNRPMTVLVYDELGAWQQWQNPTTDVNGRWEIEAETSPGWRIQAWCANARGDAIRLDLTVD